MRRLALCIALMLGGAGCVPVIAGALIVKSSKTKGQKQEFMAQLQRTNIDREAKGLAPLDWCSEAYRFDKGWAQQDAECNRRILAYEGGDLKALNAQMAPAPADSTGPEPVANAASASKP